MTSALNYEKKFREFLNVKRLWLELINKHVRFHSENAYGQLMRPIAVTNDIAVLEEAKDLLRQWNKFAKFAEDYREQGGTSGSRNDYWPVPFMISGVDRISINEGTAQAISRVSREKIISKLERRRNTLMREGLPTSNEIYDCEFDIKRFEEYPYGTMFRRRLSGYADTIITVNRMDDSEELFRVGTWGVIIDSRLLTSEVKYHKKDRKIKSFYEHCTPLSCCLYDSGALYLDEEVVRVKEQTRVNPRRAVPPSRGKRRKLEDVYDGGKPADD